ncbi:MAG TPA: cytochrome bc complex cytochrome b subunit [Vicinamibacterales bacterium]|nr:cytochrome bc complex cytochrome b subunit [Vicinamibacterales bacterium]
MTLATLKASVAERLPLPPGWRGKALDERLPVHLKTWIYALGGTPAVLFGVQVITGILLTFYYVPQPMHAFESVRQITFSVQFGWLVRGLHQAASQLMIVAVLLHMIRVFVTRGYRRPREVIWVIGVALFLLTLGFAFTGYALVYDQLSYWATTVGTNMLAEVPLIGTPLLYMLRGGADVNPQTLTRFYNFHIGVIPTMFFVLLVGHILLVRLHGVSELEEDDRTDTYSFFPDHVLREAAVALVVLLAIVVYVMAAPPQLGDKADPNLTPTHIRPEWYFFPSYRWLKLVPLQVGLWTSTAFVLAMFLWPWIDRAIERVLPGRRIGTFVGVTFWLLTLVLLVWEAFS